MPDEINPSPVGTLGTVSAEAHRAASTTEVLAFEVPGRWPVEKAQAWYRQQPWLVGCNYIPATAINQLEMWQAATFDPQTIARELDLAHSLGFNCLRVYLHDLVWADHPEGLYQRMDHFLEICSRHQMRTIFVFFDDCHRPFPFTGPQPAPVPAYHNSGWMNSPARDIATAFSENRLPAPEIGRLRDYLQATLTRFAEDPRVLLWELYNEPGREFPIGQEGQAWFGDRSAALLLASCQWARAVAPSQPICSTAEGSVGTQNIALAKLNSDVHSFHNYDSPDILEKLCQLYAEDPRPSICTEYMARPQSTFQSSLPIFKKYSIGAINWGLVAGKTGTIWPWSSKDGRELNQPWEKEATNPPGQPLPEPADIWFHDIFRTDGTPFDPEEITFLRQIIQ